MFPAGGLPSRKMERSAIGAGCKMPQGAPGRKGSTICRSTMQPTIRAGRSHLPCGTIGRARLAEKMGGTGEGNANQD